MLPRLLTLLGVALGLAAPLTQAQDWPTKPIRLVIPYAAGGGGDLTMRPLLPALAQQLGQQIYIDNKSGASGNIGASEVARAAPDGYTLLLGATNNFVTNQFLYKSLNYDPLTAFKTITVVSNAPTVVAVHPSLPVNSLQELAAYARANPGKLNYGSPGVGTPAHLAGEWFSSIADVKLVHVPFKGSPPAVVALLGNEVQVYFTPLSPIASHVQSGKLKLLAVAAPERLAILPQVPTSREAGFPALLTGNWWALAAPAGTDPRILERLEKQVRAALTDPAVQNLYRGLGMVVVGNTQAQAADMLRSEALRWKGVIERAGVTAE